MQEQGTYYLARIIKKGQLKANGLIEALVKPVTIFKRNNAWTFTDVILSSDNKTYAFGKLTKYSPKKNIKKIDPDRRSELNFEETNVLNKSSPFIYIPEYSGIAFLHVPNHIEPPNFAQKFCEIVNITRNSALNECEINMITDLSEFYTKLLRLQGINNIDVTVHPPNPLFGIFWKTLKEYLVSRNTDKMRISEQSPQGGAINTELNIHVQNIINKQKIEIKETNDVKIGDAAILMAADGYGDGIIEGKSDGEAIVIRTSESIKNFRFSKEPDGNEIYKKAYDEFSKIKEERQMDH